jgi:type IV secretion system protein VirB4
LNALPFAFRWSHRVLPLGTAEAAKQIRRHQLQWFKKRKGAAAWVQELVGGKRDAAPRADDELWLDQDARSLAHDAALAAAENASGAVRFCCFTQVAIVMDPDAARADVVAGEILKVLNEAGCPARLETVNALEAYLGSLPGHGYPNLRRPLLSTRNIADLLPVTSVWPGLPTNPSPFFPPQSPPLLWAATAGSTPFRVHLHDSDVGHTLVLGKTGSGKSVLLALLAAQFRRYPGAQVFAFDVGYAMWALAHAAGARHYDLAAGRVDVLCFQPLARIDDPAERAWAADWLETVLGLQGVTVTPPLRARIDRALELVGRNEPPHRTLIELTVQLQDETLAAALRPYTVAGNYGQLLDAGTDDLAEGRFQVFELKHLLALDDRIALPVLLYLFRRIEERLDGSPTLLLIDEAWMALMHSLFGARVHQWLLQLRKQNAAVVLATQSPAQLAQLAHRHTIVDSCVTKIYLPNPEAATPAQAPLYHALGLNDREIAMIARATPKRHYYFTSPRGSRLVELGVGPVALSFLAADPGASMAETRRHLETLMATHGPDWPAARLEERGLGHWAERLRAFHPEHGDSVDDVPVARARVG